MCSFLEDSVRKVCSENGKIVFCARCFRCSDAKTAQVSKNAARSCHSHSAIPIPPGGLFFPIKKNVPRHILAPRRGCFSNHLPLRRVCIPAERFLSYRNEVSYTIKKFPTDMNLFHPHLSGILFLTQLICAAHICYLSAMPVRFSRQ